MGVRMEPPSPNREYEFIVNDNDRLSDEEIEWRMNTRLYCHFCHKLWKPWVFTLVITNFLVVAIDRFTGYGFEEFLIGFMIGAPIACFINAWQEHDNNRLRDIYKVNTEALRRQSKIEEMALIGAGLSCLNSGKKTISHSLKPHNKKI